jgi:hypothetical protein
MASKTLFYSWQSDLNPDEHQYLIRDSLKSALKIINKEIDFDLSLDKDTQKTSGSPDIVETIFRKIRTADIFVADVTVVNPDYNGRKTPNPNVLIELGYAVKVLGWERIICIVNIDQCKPEDLPFDIRNNRTSIYSVTKAGIRAAEKGLTATMIVAIKTIIDDYDNILERLTKNDYIAHDKQLFKTFNELCSQTDLHDGLDFLCTTLSVYDSQYRLWRKVKSFSDALENQFLNKEIQESFQAFVHSLVIIHLSAAKNLFLQDKNDMKWTDDYIKKGIEITPDIQFEIDQTHRHSYPDFHEIWSDDLNAYEKRRYKAQDTFNRETDIAIAAYKVFRLTVKRTLFI